MAYTGTETWLSDPEFTQEYKDAKGFQQFNIEGTYTTEITNVYINNEQKNLKIVTRIIEGEHAGIIIPVTFWRTNKKSAFFLKKALHSIGIFAKEPSEIPSYIDDLIGMEIVVRISIYKNNGKEYVNQEITGLAKRKMEETAEPF